MSLALKLHTVYSSDAVSLSDSVLALLSSADPAPWHDKSQEMCQMYTSTARLKSLKLEFDILEKLHYTL